MQQSPLRFHSLSINVPCRGAKQRRGYPDGRRGGRCGTRQCGEGQDLFQLCGQGVDGDTGIAARHADFHNSIGMTFNLISAGTFTWFVTGFEKSISGGWLC